LRGRLINGGIGKGMGENGDGEISRSDICAADWIWERFYFGDETRNE